ncbi:unnamed protein product, partial [Rhizoctonia solani]
LHRFSLDRQRVIMQIFVKTWVYFPYFLS